MIRVLLRRLLFVSILASSVLRLQASDYAIGVDVSFLKQAESQGRVFRDAGVEKPALQIFKDHGYNWVRLRLFNNPPELPNDLAYTTALAHEAKRLGFKFLLDFHYSDTWADPGKQFPPKAWETKTHAELIQAVRDFTRDTIVALREAGAMPDMVQIGNEITSGMLWPDGRLPDHWDQFAELLKAGSDGVAIGAAGAQRPRVMIHIDRGADMARTKWFFGELQKRDVAFDVIGQSYYPWWHGTLLDLRDNLVFMAETYHKDIMIVETGYPWKPSEYREVAGPFPESPQGQRDFLDEVNRLVLATPRGLGRGIFWWEPVWPDRANPHGMFDENGDALPVVYTFDPWTKGKRPKQQPAPSPTRTPSHID